jgi:hypothetical protein
MEPLYKSQLMAACHLCGATESLAWCSNGAEDAAGDAEARRMDQPRVSRGGVCRR